jgi:hypothetical protein
MHRHGQHDSYSGEIADTKLVNASLGRVQLFQSASLTQALLVKCFSPALYTKQLTVQYNI